MTKFRPIFFLGALFELLRIGILFILAVNFISPEVDQVHILFFVLLAAPGFMIFAGYLFLGLNPLYYQRLVSLLIVGKMAELFPALLAALNTMGIITFESATYQLESMGLLFGIIVLFDLLFFLFLVSYNRRLSRINRTKKPSENIHHSLPDIEEVEIEE